MQEDTIYTKRRKSVKRLCKIDESMLPDYWKTSKFESTLDNIE